MNMTSYQYECLYVNRMLVHNLHFELMSIAYSNEYNPFISGFLLTRDCT